MILIFLESLNMWASSKLIKLKASPQSVHMNIYKSNTYGKDSNWLHFDDEPMIEERQQEKDQ